MAADAAAVTPVEEDSDNKSLIGARAVTGTGAGTAVRTLVGAVGVISTEAPATSPKVEEDGDNGLAFLVGAGGIESRPEDFGIASTRLGTLLLGCENL
mmetsp:Transcript_133794/g.286139  ORF Transcript_133794/g.286139 Transcript_133794/m.286139 type:complete len:98 (+) Transcript_133794:617-910(+)